MAELADAHGSGPCESNFMGVQVPLSAPYEKLDFIGLFFFCSDKNMQADALALRTVFNRFYARIHGHS